MPMEVAALETQAEAGFSITPGTQKETALRVLAGNPETAFTPTEIADRTAIPTDNASTVCGRLAEMGAAATANGHYYLPRDDTTAAAVQRALGSAHQQELAQKTAVADETTLSEGESDSLSDADVDTELTDISEELS